MTIQMAKDQAAREYGYEDWKDMEFNAGLPTSILNRALEIYGQSQWNEAIDKAAESAEIKMEKKSQHKKGARWSLAKENEIDLFQYEVKYSVNKQSILKLKK